MLCYDMMSMIHMQRKSTIYEILEKQITTGKYPNKKMKYLPRFQLKVLDKRMEGCASS